MDSMKFYLGGHSNFGNRGCEALVRSITAIVRDQIGNAEFICPSYDIKADRAQWPQAESVGVRFFPITQRATLALRAWTRLDRLIPQLEGFGPPPGALPPHVREEIAKADAFIMTGGDVLSLDYGPGALYRHVAEAEAAMRAGKPTYLWAASIGPFSKSRRIEKFMGGHLRRYTAITVRESETLNYLTQLEVEEAALVADPAFLLRPEAADAVMRLADSRTYLGLNLSPLVRTALPTEAQRRDFDREAHSFIRSVLERTDLSIVLVPHVAPLDGNPNNSDSTYMLNLLNQLNAPDRVVIAPPTLNAAQLKGLIGKCAYFIGARTHSTIAAISQGIPTISIAYSVKAVGINRDLFGSTKYVLPTLEVSAASLWTALELIRSENAGIRQLLAERLPEWRMRARGPASALSSLAHVGSA